MANFDPKCYELATYFLEDREPVATEAQINSLAGAIQQAIQDWMKDEDDANTAGKLFDKYIDRKIDERKTGAND